MCPLDVNFDPKKIRVEEEDVERDWTDSERERKRDFCSL